MKEWRTIWILIPIWGLIQAGLVYSVDRQPGPTVLWFLIFIAVVSGAFASIRLTTKLQIWMMLYVPFYGRWVVNRLRRKKRLTINPLQGIFLGMAPGSLFGPIFGIGISQLLELHTRGFRAAWIGMAVGIGGMALLGVIGLTVHNVFAPPISRV